MIGVQNQNLPYPSRDYPVTVGQFNVPQLVGTNEITLLGGQGVYVPGNSMVIPGKYSQVQWEDPVTNIWWSIATSQQNDAIYIPSDNFNYRVINPTGCVVGVAVKNGGTGYTTTSLPAVTVSSGGATAVAVVGGAVGAVTLKTNSGTVTSGAGANYSLVPIVCIDAPPAGGVQATAHCTLSGTAINGFVMDNQGAGYTAAPNVTIVPQPWDVNLGTITTATAQATLSGTGSVTAVLVTNYGNPLGGVPAVTIAAPTAGVTATADAIMALSATAYTVQSGGSGYVSPVEVRTVGGDYNTATAFTNPQTQAGMYEVRPAVFVGAVSGGSITATGSRLIDGGLFQTSTPSVIISGGVAGNSTPSSITQVASVNLTLGSQTDTVLIQSIGGGI